MARLWPTREAPPVLWMCFCQDWLGLSSTKTAQWWQAITQARWSRAVELRSMVLTQAALATEWRAVMRLYADTMAPAALLGLLEDLIVEGMLPPVVARRIEERVLAQTNIAGRWKGTG